MHFTLECCLLRCAHGGDCTRHYLRDVVVQPAARREQRRGTWHQEPILEQAFGLDRMRIVVVRAAWLDAILQALCMARRHRQGSACELSSARLLEGEDGFSSGRVHGKSSQGNARE